MRCIISAVLFLIGCDFPSDCDEKIRELYPTQDMIVWIVNSDVTVYRVGDQYLTCDISETYLDVRMLSPKTWDEAYCNRMVHPKECLAQKQTKTAEKAVE